MLALDNLNCEIRFMNNHLSCLNHAYIENRCKKLQIRVNNLYKLADNKGGRVKDVLYNGLELIQSEIDSILWAIEQ